MENRKAHKLVRDGAFRNIQHKNIVAEIRPIVKQINSNFNTDQPQFLNQVIVDLVKFFITENKPNKAIKVLQAFGLGDGLAEYFVSAILEGVIA
jgi:hypothetical protein